MGRDLTAITYPFKSKTLSISLSDIPIRMFTDMKMEITRHLARGVEYVHLAGVAGHIAEFGTATGLTSSCLAMALAEARELYGDLETRHGLPARKLFLFDSFQGLPDSQAEADQGSLHVRTGVWGPGACKALEELELRQMCEQFIDGDSIQIFNGWYADTLALIASGTRFALVHLDCDLYESTRQVLHYLLTHDHLADGCALFFDDWSCNHASPKYGQRRAFNEWVKQYGVSYEDCGEYGRMSRKIILHIDVVNRGDTEVGPGSVLSVEAPDSSGSGDKAAKSVAARLEDLLELASTQQRTIEDARQDLEWMLEHLAKASHGGQSASGQELNGLNAESATGATDSQDACDEYLLRYEREATALNQQLAGLRKLVMELKREMES